MPTKVCVVKIMVFPVVKYRCESSTIKKAEHRRIYAFKLWCWRRLLRALGLQGDPTSQSWRKSALNTQGQMLTLQYFGHVMWRTNALEKTLMLGKIEDNRRRGWMRMRWLDSLAGSMDMNLSKPWKTVEDRGAWHATIHEVAKSWTWLSDWTTTVSVSPWNMSEIMLILCLKTKKLWCSVSTLCSCPNLFFYYSLFCSLCSSHSGLLHVPWTHVPP